MSTTGLLRLYAEVDHATGQFLRQHPSAACVQGCADCCRTRPPLVSAAEGRALAAVLATRPAPVREAVRARARNIALELARGRAPDFPCPVLVEEPGQPPRCAAYQGRPYACRTFGHTARYPDGDEHAVPFTCEHLRPRVALLQPPPMPFRSQALRQFGDDGPVLADSYVPIWLGLDDDEREEVESGPGTRVVVGRPRTGRS